MPLVVYRFKGDREGQKELPEDGWIVRTIMGQSKEVLQRFSNIICYCSSEASPWSSLMSVLLINYERNSDLKQRVSLYKIEL
jgi:hypothetical protein